MLASEPVGGRSRATELPCSTTKSAIVAVRTTVVYGVFVVGVSLGRHFAFVAHICTVYINVKIVNAEIRATKGEKL